MSEEFDTLSHLWHACRRQKRGAFAGDVWISYYMPWKKFGFQQIKMSGVWQVMAKVGGYELMRREHDGGVGDRHVWETKMVYFPGENHQADCFVKAIGEIIVLPEIKTTKRKKAS